MKVTTQRRQPTFEPITMMITIETQAQFDALFVLSKLDATVPAAVRDFELSSSGDSQKAIGLKAELGPMLKNLNNALRLTQK